MSFAFIAGAASPIAEVKTPILGTEKRFFTLTISFALYFSQSESLEIHGLLSSAFSFKIFLFNFYVH